MTTMTADKDIEQTSSNTLSEPLGVTDIMEVIPHRYPFLLVDKIVEYIPGKWVRAIKNVTMNEPYFQGHFPDEPIMPGVLQIEAMAQSGAWLVRKMIGSDSSKLAVLAGIDNCRFRRMVKPGDQLVLEGELTRYRDPIGKSTCKAFVDGELVASCDIIFSLVETDPEKQ